MKKLITVCVAALIAACILSAPQQAQARPEYQKAFLGKYGENEAIKKAVEEKKCGVCHGMKKSDRSEYAKALGKALDAKMVKDEKKILEALGKVDEMKIKDGEDKTYGALLKDGKLPEPFKAP